MSLFLPTIPTGNQNLDFSQGQLLSNNQGLDTVFGIDHYKFSDATSNKGFHNTVTQPLIVGSAHPTTTTNPIIYAMQDYSAIGVIQYSRGPSNAVPSPITTLQSPAAGITLNNGASETIIDLDTVTLFVAMGYSIDGSNPLQAGQRFAYIVYSGGLFTIQNNTTSGLLFNGAGTMLQVTNNGNNTNNFFWTLQILRVQ